MVDGEKSSDYIMTGKELANRCVDIAKNFKTIYMYACYGFQVTIATIQQKAAQNLNGWYTQANIKKLEAVANQHPPTWGFDCVNLIKGILWGWTGDPDKVHGGAVYASNGIPDTNADGMIARCSGVTTDFSRIEIGEAVWMSGHIGVYIGDGLAAECTPRWKDGVQITAVFNIGKKSGYNGRTWTKHGKLPRVGYNDASDTVTPAPSKRRLLKYGSKGDDVKALQERLIELGYGKYLGKWGADGDFGRATEDAVEAFQDDHGLEVDGEVGPKTWAALDAATGQPPEPKYTITIHGVDQAEMEAMRQRWPEAEVTEE